MPKYNCTVIFDASSTINVKADSPEEAAMLAEDMTSGNQTLCHQCSNTLETGDAIGVHVYDEDSTEHFLDTTHRGQPAAQWVGLEPEEIWEIAYDRDTANGPLTFARAIEAKLREKNGGGV